MWQNRSIHLFTLSGNKQDQVPEKEPEHWFHHDILNGGMCRGIYKEITRFRGKVTIQSYYHRDMMSPGVTHRFSLLNVTSYSCPCLKFESTPKYPVFVLVCLVF